MEISVEYYNKMIERLTELEYILAEQPEIIRCKDCEYWWNKHLCKIFSKYGSIKTYEDDFCSYGERREDG